MEADLRPPVSLHLLQPQVHVSHQFHTYECMGLNTQKQGHNSDAVWRHLWSFLLLFPPFGALGGGMMRSD